MRVRTLPLRGDPRGRPALLVQVAVLSAFLVAYDALRDLAPGRVDRAFSDADQVLDAEGGMRIAVEHRINTVVAAHHHLALVLSTYYDSAHYVVTLPLLVAVYVWRPRHYRGLRDVLIVTNGVGLLGFATYPLAPPRMLPGYVDTVAVTGALGGWAHTITTNANEYAAMPSLHAGWALWCVVVTWRVTSRPAWRALAATHCGLTVLVVVATANHYLLDAVAGAACLAVALLLVRATGRLAEREQLSEEPAAAPMRLDPAHGVLTWAPEGGEEAVLARDDAPRPVRVA